MSEHQSHIIRIANKLKLLLKQQEQLRRENERLRAATVAKDQELFSLKVSLVQMEEKIAVLNASAGKMEGRDRQEFERKISQYIKDIDKVIAYFNA